MRRNKMYRYSITSSAVARRSCEVAANLRNKFAPPHSIISSALVRS
jgi:hypothetical protein